MFGPRERAHLFVRVSGDCSVVSDKLGVREMPGSGNI